MTTITGHLVGMVPVASIHEREVKVTERWFRSNDVSELQARIADLEAQKSRLLDEIEGLKRRREPKRMGK